MSLVDDPHYEISSEELAIWVEQQGTDVWWNIDGDPRLTSILSIPCPGDELAAGLRRVGRPLLIVDPSGSVEARGQVIDHSQLDSLIARLGDTVQITRERPLWFDNRFLYLCWKDRDELWMLTEDLETTQSSREDAAVPRGSS